MSVRFGTVADMAMDFVCPTGTPPGLRPDEPIILGCGTRFTGEPDDEGIVDRPHCGIWFHPATERGVSTPTAAGETP